MLQADFRVGSITKRWILVDEPLWAGRSGWVRLTRSGVQVAMFSQGGAAFRAHSFRVDSNRGALANQDITRLPKTK
jgi:hypothetical protein